MVMEEVSDYVMRKIWKKFLVPAVINHVAVYVVSSLCSFFLISRYCGKNELVVFSMFEVILQLKKAFDAYWGSGSTQEFSRLKGAGNAKEAQNIFAETLTGYLLIGGIAYGALCFFVPWIVTGVFNLKDLRDMGISFGMYFMVYIFVTSISHLLLRYLTCDGMPKYNAAISLAGNCSMLVFQILFIGILRLNMRGYLYAGFLSELIMILSCIAIFLVSKQATLHLRFRLPRRHNLYALWTFSCGSLVKTLLSFVCSILIMRWILTGYGKDVVSIYALARQVKSLVYAVSCGYLDSIQMLASMFRGEENQNGLISTWRRGFFYGMRAQLILITVMFFLAPVLVKYMLSPSIDFDQAVWGVRIITVFLVAIFPMDFRIVYYNACGHAKLVSICSFCNEIIMHVGSVALFYYLEIPEKWFWFSRGLDYVGQFLMVIGIAELWRRHKNYSNRMLLEPESKTKQLSFVMKNSVQDLQDYRFMLDLFLKRNGVTEKQIQRARLLFEELFLFASEKTTDIKQNFFFINAKILSPEKIKIDLKYDSRESCLNSVLVFDKYNVSLDRVAGVIILKKLSDFMRVDRVLGINIVSIELNVQNTGNK